MIACAPARVGTWRIMSCFLIGAMALGARAGNPEESLPHSRFSIGATEAQLPPQLWFRPVSHVFRYQNIGGASLELSVSQTSCGCLTNLLSSEALPPGATGEIEVGYSPKKDKKRTGSQSFTVTLAANDPERPTVQLALKVDLVEPVDADPKTVDFGRLSPGETATATLEVRCLGEATAPEVVSVEPSSESLTVKPLDVPCQQATEAARGTAPASADDGVRAATEGCQAIVSGTTELEELVRTCHVFEVLIHSPDGEGTIRENLLIRSDSQVVPLVEVPVIATVGSPTARSTIDVEPPRVLFGVVEPGKWVEKKARITALSGGRSGKLSPFCADPRIASDLSQTGEDVWELLLTFTPGSAAGRLKTSVDVRNGSGETVAVIPIYGIVLEKKDQTP